MKKRQNSKSADGAALRQRAEGTLIAKQAAKLAPRSSADTQRLVHELQVHQIELEMQNDELRRMHAEVEAGLVKYTDLYDFAPVGYVSLDRCGNIRAINLTGAALLETERSKLLGRRLGAYVAAADLPVFNAFVQKVFAVQPQEHCEVTLRNEPHLSRQVQLQAIAAKQGQECRAVMVDITAAKAMQRQLRLNTTAMEAAANGIVITDAQGSIEWVNPAFQQLTGYTREEAIGKNPRILASGRHPQSFYKDLWTTITTGKVWHGTLFNKRKDGSIYAEEMTITPFVDAVGQVLKYIAIKQDITAQEQQRLALEESETRLRTIFANTTDGIFMAHSWTEPIDYANNQACKMLGYTPDEILKLRIPDIHPAADRLAIMKRFKQRLHQAPPLHRPEYRILRKDGTLFDAELNPIRVQLDGDDYVVGFLRDITERKHGEAEKQRYAVRLRELASEITYTEERERKRLARILHDDLVQLLIVMSFKLDEVDRPDHDVNIAAAMKAARDLLQQSINAARSVTLKLSNPALYDLGLMAGIAWLITDMKNFYPLLQINFQALRERSDVVLPVRILLFQCVRELLTNAAKHSGANTAAVQIRYRRQAVKIVVTDNGKGFDLESRQASGHVGFGLFSIGERLKNFGGEMTIDSAPGCGTKITLNVPDATRELGPHGHE